MTGAWKGQEMPEDTRPELLRKIDILIGVTAVAAVDGKPQTEQIQVLSGVGLTPGEIAKLIGTTASTVRATLSKLKARGKQAAASK